jgi:hypothetical protein
VDLVDKSMIRMDLEDDRGEQGRIDRTAPLRAILKHRHVVDLDQWAGLIDDCDRALNADIDPEMQGHGAAPAIASKAAPGAGAARRRIYSGITLKALGFPVSMFTVLFAVARTAGWIAQWKEMIEDPSQKIGRPRQLYIGSPRRDYVAIDKRSQ